jgi:hypothetical protein
MRMATERMQRLKDLIDALSRQPPSPDRDRLLGEVRSRMVDLDTGVTPRAMLPLHEPPPAAPVAAKPQRRAAVTRLPEPQHAPSGRLPVPTARPSSHPEPVRWPADLLTLEDTPLPHAPAYGDQTERPWTLGLRG